MLNGICDNDLRQLTKPDGVMYTLFFSFVVIFDGFLYIQGMKSTIHMSSEAKEWKKRLLRQQRGCTVVEHQGSYSDAVAEGRKATERETTSHFIDDETSQDLFLGYACAAKELQRQLEEGGYLDSKESGGGGGGGGGGGSSSEGATAPKITAEKKIVVYIPCGVGGAPSGICWGLKHVFGARVVVLFAEPTHAPCVLLAMGDATKKDKGSKKRMTCMEMGLDVRTEADGLACGEASPLCCTMVNQLCDGIFTVDDNDLFRRLADFIDAEGAQHFMEPSCCAALEGPHHLQWMAENGRTKKEREWCVELLENSIHVIWATGGALVPEIERIQFIERGRTKN